ncbi:hypothetical protein ACFQZI_01135 [Mucilaginibacter lutimaris]|uniref:Bulb-type lectin domain-containing protein n=1 Tax=Mucilaginibacter lutimaris TaxID=931629 RepID=A0ABW2Z9W4_9SPHI
MKKTAYFLLITSIFTALFISCQKDKNSSLNDQKTLSAINNVKADSLSKNDTGVYQRPKAVNTTCTPLHSSFLVNRAYTDYIIIGRFPATKADPNVTLPRQEWINGNYRLVNQADGNLILYKGAPSEANLIWKSASNSVNGTTNRWFKLQTDLNMVEYDVNTAVWSSRTQPYECPPSGGPNFGKLPGNTMLVLTNDGDLEIVANATNAFGEPCRAILAISRTAGGAKSPNIGSFFLTYNATIPQPFGPGSLDYN